MSGHKTKFLIKTLIGLVAISLTVLAQIALADGGKSMPVNAIPASIRDGSAKELAKYIFTDPAKESAAIGEIKKGNRDWLKLFPKLFSGTDAAWSEELLAAIPYGLKINPKEVLEAIKQSQILVPQLEHIAKNNCGDTVEGYDEGPPQVKLAKSAIKELNARKVSLIKVKDKSLSNEKEGCLAGIEYSRERWEKRLDKVNHDKGK